MKTYYVYHAKQPTFMDLAREFDPMEFQLVARVVVNKDVPSIEDVFRATNHIDCHWWDDEQEGVTTTPFIPYVGGGMQDAAKPQWRSTSVGDVIEQDDIYHLCCATGWAVVPKVKEAKEVLPFDPADIKRVASEVGNWLQDAAGDVAEGNIVMQSDLFESWLDNGGSDVRPQFRKESFTDHVYDDVGTMVDLMGDRVADEADTLGCGWHTNHNARCKIAIAEEIKAANGGGVKKACQVLIERWQEQG